MLNNTWWQKLHSSVFISVLSSVLQLRPGFHRQKIMCLDPQYITEYIVYLSFPPTQHSYMKPWEEREGGKEGKERGSFRRGWNGEWDWDKNINWFPMQAVTVHVQGMSVWREEGREGGIEREGRVRLRWEFHCSCRHNNYRQLLHLLHIYYHMCLCHVMWSKLTN